MKREWQFTSISSLAVTVSLAVLFLWPVDRAAAQAISSELAKFVAGKLAEKSRKDGVLIAHVVTTEAGGNPAEPVRVWRVSGGKLVDESAEALERALCQ